MMRPIDESPILQMLRGKRPAAVAWFASASLLTAGYAVASHLELWDAYLNFGMYVCFDAPAGCEAPEPHVHVLGELLSFSLLFLGGVSAFVAAGLSLLRPGRHWR